MPISWRASKEPEEYVSIDADLGTSGSVTVDIPGSSSPEDVALGALVEIRDETWLVSTVENTADGALLTVRGVSSLVEGTSAQFYTTIDEVRAFRPEDTRIVADSSSHYVQSRLWLESILRKTSLPVSSPDLAVTPHVLADVLGYQREAVSKALEPDRLRSRLLGRV